MKKIKIIVSAWPTLIFDQHKRNNDAMGGPMLNLVSAKSTQN